MLRQCLEGLLRRVRIASVGCPILPHGGLPCILVRLEFLDFRTVHVLGHIIGLPLFEAAVVSPTNENVQKHSLEAQTFMTIVLVVGLIFLQ